MNDIKVDITVTADNWKDLVTTLVSLEDEAGETMRQKLSSVVDFLKRTYPEVKTEEEYKKFYIKNIKQIIIYGLPGSKKTLMSSKT